MKKQYRISQTWETLGAPAAVTCHTRRAAEREAAQQRREIAAMVAEMETPSDDEEGENLNALTGDTERHGWEHALTLAEGGRTYGTAAGEYIAGLAVSIEQV